MDVDVQCFDCAAKNDDMSVAAATSPMVWDEVAALLQTQILSPARIADSSNRGRTSNSAGVHDDSAAQRVRNTWHDCICVCM